MQRAITTSDEACDKAFERIFDVEALLQVADRGILILTLDEMLKALEHYKD